MGNGARFITAEDLLPNPNASLAVPFNDVLNPVVPTGILQWVQYVGIIDPTAGEVLQIVPPGFFDTIYIHTYGINPSQAHQVRIDRGMTDGISNPGAQVVVNVDVLSGPRKTFASSREDVITQNTMQVYVPLCNVPFWVRIDAVDASIFVTVTLLTIRGGYQK